LIGGPVEKL